MTERERFVPFKTRRYPTVDEWEDDLLDNFDMNSWFFNLLLLPVMALHYLYVWLLHLFEVE